MNRIFSRWISILLAVALLLPTSFLAPTAKAESVDVPVILYHRIMQSPNDSWTHTSIEKFRSTMKYLDENGYTTLTAEQYVDIVSGSADPADIPAKPILLTFDDGTPDFITNALPILDEYDMNAVLFIVTGWIGGGFSMSHAQLEDLAQNHPNVSIQNHTVYHKENTWNSMSEEDAANEILEANQYIEDLTGEAPTLLAYPYGHYHDPVKAAAEANGIKYAFKVGYPNGDNYAMGRHYVMMDTTLTEIAGWLGGPPPEIEEGNLPEPTTVYEEHFVNGQGKATQSGNAQLTHVTDKIFEGNEDGAAIYVSERTKDYDAVDFNFIDIGLKDGKSYEVTTTIYVDAEETIPDGAQAAVLTVDSYGNWKAENYVAGQTITLKQQFTVDMKTDKAFRIQSDAVGASVPFYIGHVSFVNLSGDEEEPIKDTYKDHFLIGNVVSSRDLEGIRLELLKKHHNIVTAENAMKPDQVYNADGEFDFSAEDELVNKVLAEDLQMFGHVLVWHQQSPEWLHTDNDEPLSSEEALNNLRTHIKTAVKHFGDRVIGWDVLNEAFNDNPQNPENWRDALRKSGWYNAIGSDYVELAYVAAREAINELKQLEEYKDLELKLYYNDYNDDNQNKSIAIASMVKELNEKYAEENDGQLLIDGIGMQGHYNINTNPENVRASLERFIATGAEVSVTELDITAGSENQLTEEQAKKQGYLYASLFEIYKEHSEHIARVTFWGLDDGSSWRSAQSPLLFDSSLKAKPAFYAVNNPAKYLNDYEIGETEAKQATAKYGTPIIDGKIDKVWSSAPEIPINTYQSAWQGASGVGKALWDNKNLYVLIQVNDAQLDKSSAAEHEQDSIEVFLDQNNAKTPSYQDDDGQYRVNYDNETSFNPAKIAEGFKSAVHVDGTNYTVEVKIPLNAITPSNNVKLGFDLQINDAKDGARQSVAAWNDTTGTGYMDTSVYGVLTLTGKPGSPTGNDSNSEPSAPADSDSNIITPEVTNTNNQIVGKVTSDQLKKALAANKENDKKQVTIDLTKQASASSYEIQLPAESLDNDEDYVISINTAHGTINLSSQALSGTSVSEGQISIMITPSSAQQLDEALRERIGNHPVLNVNLQANDEVIAWNNTAAPAVISIPYTPTADELQSPDSIVVLYIDQDGNTTTIPNGRYDAATQSVVFQTNQLGSFAVAYADNSFDDLENVQWAKQAIAAMAARDIIRGTSASSYAPQQSIQRADFIALLVRALGLQGTDNSTAMFSDVQEDDYFYNELAIARELGIANGFEDNTFRPDSSLSRQDMMVLAARALAAAGKQTGASGSLDAFSDADSVAGYARDQIARLVQAGIVNGKNGKLAPQDELTRAEAAVILYRIWGM